MLKSSLVYAEVGHTEIAHQKDFQCLQLFTDATFNVLYSEISHQEQRNFCMLINYKSMLN